jgi:hypothetical protein
MQFEYLWLFRWRRSHDFQNGDEVTGGAFFDMEAV